MNAWQFLASLPVAVWFAVLIIAGLAVVLLFGGAVASVLVTLIKGGKVKVSKDGVEAETEEHTEEAQK